MVDKNNSDFISTELDKRINFVELCESVSVSPFSPKEAAKAYKHIFKIISSHGSQDHIDQELEKK